MADSGSHDPFPASPKKSGPLSVLLELTKIRLVALVLWSTAVGYLLALRRPVPWASFLTVLFATGLVAAGSLALNQWMERRFDALMKRTEKRPLPAGKIRPLHALVIGLILSATGLVLLFAVAHWLCGFLAALTLVSYLLVYTPLKRLTSLNTLAGAIPGAIPPMIGWAAVRGSIDYQAWVLFAILFLWQLPHFLAIAWLFRDQYSKAGFVMISMDDPGGGMVARQAVVSCALLLPVSLLPTIFGMTGYVYFVMALVLGAGLLGVSIAGLKNLEKNARPLFLMSILYLSLLLLMMVIDRR